MSIQRKVALVPINSSKFSKRRLPWVSLTLLTSTYAILGLFLEELSINRISWILTITGVILITIVATFPQFNIEKQISKWLKSDISSFIILTISAALISVILLWLHIFLKIIAILAAEILVKLELYHNNFGVAQSFWMTLIASFAGLSLGWFIHTSI